MTNNSFLLYLCLMMLSALLYLIVIEMVEEYA